MAPSLIVVGGSAASSPRHVDRPGAAFVLSGAPIGPRNINRPGALRKNPGWNPFSYAAAILLALAAGSNLPHQVSCFRDSHGSRNCPSLAHRRKKLKGYQKTK